MSKTKKSFMDVFERPPLKMFTLETVAMRPGSLNVLQYPSRIVNTLFYPDGRVVCG